MEGSPFPAWRKPDHERVKVREEGIRAMFSHRFIAHALKFFEVIALMTQFSIFKAQTAVPIGFALARIFGKRHQATFAVETRWFHRKIIHVDGHRTPIREWNCFKKIRTLNREHFLEIPMEEVEGPSKRKRKYYLPNNSLWLPILNKSKVSTSSSTE